MEINETENVVEYATDAVFNAFKNRVFTRRKRGKRAI